MEICPQPCSLSAKQSGIPGLRSIRSGTPSCRPEAERPREKERAYVTQREAAKPRCLIPRLVLSPPESLSVPTLPVPQSVLDDDPLAPGTALGPEKGTFPASISYWAVPRWEDQNKSLLTSDRALGCRTPSCSKCPTILSSLPSPGQP